MMWQLHESCAELSQGTLSATLDVAHPQKGLSAWRGTDGAEGAQSWQLLQIHFPDRGAPPVERTLQEVFLRGPDLVASYRPTPRQHFVPQVYWRAVPPARGWGVELILSLQTSLLDSQPELSIVSHLPAGPIYGVPRSAQPLAQAPLPPSRTLVRAAEEVRSLLLVRPNGAEWSYVEMIHPSDFYELQIELQGAGGKSRWTLFPERLEKGVIRRGRVRGYLLPREEDTAQAEHLFREFAAAEPPLTA